MLISSVYVTNKRYIYNISNWLHNVSVRCGKYNFNFAILRRRIDFYQVHFGVINFFCCKPQLSKS